MISALALFICYQVYTGQRPWAVKFDEKGNLMVPSEKERKEKEDKKHKGLYLADPEDLHNNAVVQVTLVKKEGSSAKVPDILRIGPKPGSDPNPEIKLDANILASLIVIVGDGQQAPPK